MFTGLCIDGPLKGKWLDHSSPYYRMAKSPEIPELSAAPVEAPPDLTVSYIEYTHRSGTFLDKPFAVWTILAKTDEAINAILIRWN